MTSKLISSKASLGYFVDAPPSRFCALDVLRPKQESRPLCEYEDWNQWLSRTACSVWIKKALKAPCHSRKLSTARNSNRSWTRMNIAPSLLCSGVSRFSSYSGQRIVCAGHWRSVCLICIKHRQVLVTKERLLCVAFYMFLTGSSSDLCVFSPLSLLLYERFLLW